MTPPVDRLIVHLDTALPATLVVGRGQLLYLTGRCYHPVRSLRRLWIVVDGVAHAVVNHSLTRPDVPSDDPAIGDTVANCLTSGFWAAVPLGPDSSSALVALSFRADLDDGRSCVAALASLRLLPGGPAALTPEGTPPPPRVAICMATYNPDPGFFAEQVESIVGQTHQSWVAVVSDDGSAPERLQAIRTIAARDPRFRVIAHDEHRGHYGNFERALTALPADVDFVALADQDDVWYPNKLTRLLAAFRPDTTLVYSDVDVVTHDGAHVASTYWTARRNNYRDLASLVFSNTVTGAASMFRASLLADVLPFPPRIGGAYHDHWIACVALTRGDLGYVDAPLHAYRQHDDNVLGHHAPPPHRLLPTPAEILRAVSRPDPRRRVMAELWRRRDVYANDVVRLIVIARTLLLRLGRATTSAKRSTLERIAALERSPWGLIHETVAARRENRPTLGAEWHCLRGALAARLLDLHYRRNRVRLFEERLVRREVTGGASVVSATAGVTIIEQKTAPLQLRVSSAERPRLNLLMPAVDFAHLFAGYLGKLNLALRLADAGHAVRLVIVDPCEYDPPAWRRGVAGYPGLEALFDRVEVAYVGDRAVSLGVHPRDAFIATTWWTAHVAQRAATDLGRRRFVYLIQEFEPMTFPMGSLSALAAQSYDFPHFAIFSTALLRDYFRREQLGVYAHASVGDEDALTFENAIATFPVSATAMARPGPRRLLFYARPEQHAARNMFELGLLALRRTLAEHQVSPEAWTFAGIGAGRAFEPIPLAGGHRLTILPRVDLAEYHLLLPGYDVGLSLMLTPHPSLVPLEMAAAGLVTVTNTFANKTADALRALSANLVPVPPTVDGIAAGLAEAMGRVDDHDARVVGARVAWSNDWRRSFDDGFLSRLAVVLAADQRPSA